MPGVPGASAARPVHPVEGTQAARDRVGALLARQAGWCDDYGSPLSALLLRAAAADAAAGGPVWDVLAPYADDPGSSALPLRFLGGVHRLVLSRRAPELALYLPSVGGTADPAGAGAALLATVAEHAATLRELAGRPCQTNEVGRCAALLAGFLAVARSTGLPLRVLEVGASAGLNLRWDRYRYAQRDRDWAWGPPDAPLVLEGFWTVPPEPVPAEVEVVERRGCDPAPLDPTSPEGRLTLTSFVWPDQTDRLARLRGALAAAVATPAAVDREGVATWLPARLAEPLPGVATVVFQSVVAPYLSAEDTASQRAALDAAGERAGRDTPLAWLRFEHDERAGTFALDLWTWPGGAVERLATSGPHGTGMTAARLRP